MGPSRKADCLGQSFQGLYDWNEKDIFKKKKKLITEIRAANMELA